jgi:hypothetical protein
MPFYDKGDVRIRYEEAGAGFPLLVMPGGGLNSASATGRRRPSTRWRSSSTSSAASRWTSAMRTVASPAGRSRGCRSICR